MKKVSGQTFFFLGIGLTLWLSAFFIENYANRKADNEQLAKDFESRLHDAEKELLAIFQNEQFISQAVNRNIANDSIIVYEQKPYTFLIFSENDSLLFWNNNWVQPYKSDFQYEAIPQQKLNEIAGSKYLMIKRPFEIRTKSSIKRYSLVGLIPLYLRFPINNQYLFNNFPLMEADFSNYAEISNDSSGSQIKGTGAVELIKIKAKKDYPYRSAIYFAYLFYLIAVFAFLASFYKVSSKVNNRYGFTAAALLMIALMIGFRLITVYGGIPESVHELSGFQTKFSSGQQFLFYSIGDFLIDILFFSCFAIFVSHRLNFKRRLNSPLTKYAILSVIFGFIIGGIALIQQILSSIVFNPKIYFEFEDLSKIDHFTFLALFGVLMLLLSFFIVANKLFRQIRLYGIENRDCYIVSGVILMLALVYGNSLGQDFWRLFFTAFFSGLLILILQFFSKEKSLTFVWVSIWIFFFSVMATFMIEKSNMEKSIQNRVLYLKQLLDERDKELEEKTFDLENSIAADEFFYVYLSSPYIPYSQVEERLSYLYLDNAFFGRYKYEINIYNSAGNPKRPEHLSNVELMKNLSVSEKTGSGNLYFQSLENGRYNYWSIIPLKKQNILSGTIVIKLSPIVSEDESSVYVELMSNSKDMLKRSENEFSVAIYKKKQLVFSKNESFPNTYNFDEKPIKKNSVDYITKDNKSFVFLRNEKDYIGISLVPSENYIKPFSIFSYLFCAGIILVIILLFLAYTFNKLFKIRLFHISFKISLQERIQQGIVIVSLFSFVAIGIITIIYFQDEYNEYHKSRLERKIDSVVKTASWQLINQSDSTVSIPDAKELSEIHKIDVNIYNADGQLLSSSQDAVFGRRLISRQMNPTAFYKLKNDNENKLTQTERINKFEYLSGYVPLKDKSANTVAYLNLPYDFAGNSNLQSQDVAEFLGTLFNVYVIFLMIAALVAFALAKSVPRPLSIIGDKLRKIQVGGKNEKIDWKSRDEDITEFIHRFNLMIEQLEASSRELARTQRESAWREMARQVAHEIKNPLTPMKLQIQMLERVSDKDPEMARDMIKKISKSLISQIDILSNIASEFSSFAKMPAPQNEVFVLNRLMEVVCHLFTTEENIEIQLNLPDEDLSIFADPEQITRVLNNLIKNAIQAIPDEQEGKIGISLYKSDNNAIIKVSDNGVGISEERKDNIFSPYFTTKTSGTGIGLTMSKGIVESAKGKIYFQSEEGSGADFYVEVPLA